MSEIVTRNSRIINKNVNRLTKKLRGTRINRGVVTNIYLDDLDLAILAR